MPRSRKYASGVLTLLSVTALLVACGGAVPGSSEGGDDWPMSGRNPMAQRYSDAETINAGTIGKLGFAFEFRDFVVRGRTHRGVEGTPVMIGGILYFSGPWGVAYAVDAKTGKPLWTYDPEPKGRFARNACCDAINRGIAISEGRLFTAATDGQLAAVDIRTGKQLWKVETITDTRWNTSSGGTPVVAGGVVIIGNAGADMGSRGYISAYDVKNGKLAWRFWVVPGDPAEGPDETPDVTTARKTWPADTLWQLGLGGNVWEGLAFDPDTKTVFVGTGNGGPHPSWLRSTSGAATDQLYLSSIVALEAGTGRVKWHYQTTPADNWDYNASSPFVFADLVMDGKNRKVLMQAPKNGFFYVLDRINGELLKAVPYTAVNWASHIDMKTGRPVLTGKADYRKEARVVWPSMAGAHSWTPLSFSPRTGLVYIPVSEGASSFRADAKGKFVRGSISQSSYSSFAPFSDSALQKQFEEGPSQRFRGQLKAMDPVTGKVRWESPDLPFVNAGTLVLGDLVFQGTSDGYLSAYDAASGKRLLHLFVGTGIMGAPITYRIDGVQYIAVLAGFGGPQGSAFPPGTPGRDYENFERLIVLKLDGGPIPLPPRRKPEEQQPTPKAIAVDRATLARGQRLFEEHCHRCHWTGGAIGNYPNLWNMAPGTIDSFDLIVREGALEYAGMASFADLLSPTDTAAIKAFLITDTIEKRAKGPKAGAQYREGSH